VKHIDEYRDKDLIMKLSGLIKRAAVLDYTFMEVCGGHTAAIHRFGIPSLLPENISLFPEEVKECQICVIAAVCPRNLHKV